MIMHFASFFAREAIVNSSSIDEVLLPYRKIGPRYPDANWLGS